MTCTQTTLGRFSLSHHGSFSFSRFVLSCEDTTKIKLWPPKSSNPFSGTRLSFKTKKIQDSDVGTTAGKPVQQCKPQLACLENCSGLLLEAFLVPAPHQLKASTELHISTDVLHAAQWSRIQRYRYKGSGTTPQTCSNSIPSSFFSEFGRKGRRGGQPSHGCRFPGFMIKCNQSSIISIFVILQFLLNSIAIEVC